MSHKILQSTKIYRAVDKHNNIAIIFGSVSSDNNVSPRSYDTILLHYAAPNKGVMSAVVAELVDSLVQGCIVLQNGNNKSIADDAITLKRRFYQNLDRAKTIHVEKIEYTENNVLVTLGEQAISQLKGCEPRLKFYTEQITGVTSLHLFKDEPVHHAAIRFLCSDRTIKDALELASYGSKFMPSLFEGPVNEEQLAQLIGQLNKWTYRTIARKTITRFSQVTMDKLFTKDQQEDFYFKQSIDCLRENEKFIAQVREVKSRLARITISGIEPSEFMGLFQYIAQEEGIYDPGLTSEILEKAHNYGSVSYLYDKTRVTFQR
ncbi:hypothetical protein [Variovorax sp. RA8]|uniref:hypothetical protein n=1 Tax=Variovorax sp. (strain JCM 16519 / RA8) TaxID=662548 RepID=UPI000A78312D|nr:hypothetical protein [Variovorax sp. RA8]VTU34594.1 hypothetical protein RA8CHR_05004 [Variovorax sp. RA8]